MTLVITLPRSAATNPLAFARAAKRAGAHLLEIRSDLTPRVKAFTSPLPILLAIRGDERGLVKRLTPRYVDREIDAFASQRSEGSKLILSYHDYKSTPSLKELQKIVQKMCSNSPWMLKIATRINAYGDLVVHQRLRGHCALRGIPLVLLGMGEKAHLSRVLSPFRNALTYACLDGYEASASGQLPLSYYRKIRHCKTPALLGIIGGSKISSSLSPSLYADFFQKERIDAVYARFPTDDFPGTMKALKALSVRGLSVTAPFKRDAYEYADVCDPVSSALGAANTLVRVGTKWHAYNTDVDGIVRGYPELRSAQRVGILGAGGVAPAVIAAIHIANPHAEIMVYARDRKKAGASLRPFTTNVLSLRSLKKSSCDIFMNGISSDISIPLPPTHGIFIDLRYGTETKLMKEARRKGFVVLDGGPMLRAQWEGQRRLLALSHHAAFVSRRGEEAQ